LLTYIVFGLKELLVKGGSQSSDSNKTPYIRGI